MSGTLPDVVAPRAVRAGAYPAWTALFALRPVLALALPGPLRGRLRRALGR